LIRSLTLVLAMLLLGGCSQLGGVVDRQQAQSLWQQQQQALHLYDTWNIHARSVITLEREVYHVGIRWQRDKERYKLLLEAPFGQGVFRLDSVTGSAEQYRLRLPDGRSLSSASAEGLLEQMLGWSIPVSGLEFWIRGLPHPDSEFRHRLDGQGRIKSIAQGGWNIQYVDYFAPEAHFSLPRRIELSRDQLVLKLVIERWQQSTISNDEAELFPEFD
jgi:outer membrane lipoprotein LolB